MRLKHVLHLPDHIQIAALGEYKVRILHAVRAPTSKVRIVEFVCQILQLIEILLLSQLMFTFLADDCFTADALAKLERHLLANSATNHATHLINLGQARRMRCKMHLCSPVKLLQKLLMRYDELLPLFDC